MSNVVGTHLDLVAVLGHGIWYSHYTSVQDQDIKTRSLGQELQSSLLDRGEGGEIHLDDCSWRVWRLGLEFGESLLGFGLRACGEVDVGWVVFCQRPYCLLANALVPCPQVSS